MRGSKQSCRLGAAREPRAPKVCWKHCSHPHPPREAGPWAAIVRLIKNLQTGHSRWKHGQGFSMPHLPKQSRRSRVLAGRLTLRACIHTTGSKICWRGTATSLPTLVCDLARCPGRGAASVCPAARSLNPTYRTGEGRWRHMRHARMNRA